MEIDSKKRDRRHISSTNIKRMAKQCDVYNYQAVPDDECKRERARAFRTYKDYCENIDMKR